MTGNLEETTRAITSADAAHLQQAIQSVTWERRGLLQMLVRAESPTSETEVGRQPGR
jgi:hypothetical protein